MKINSSKFLNTWSSNINKTASGKKEPGDEVILGNRNEEIQIMEKPLEFMKSGKEKLHFSSTDLMGLAITGTMLALGAGVGYEVFGSAVGAIGGAAGLLALGTYIAYS